MATWEELSGDAQRAAKVLFGDKRCRDCVSRAYYSAFGACAAYLVAHGRSSFGVDQYGNEKEGPSHAGLPRLMEQVLSQRQWQKMRNDIRALYVWRIEADYRPSVEVGERRARKALDKVRHIRDVLSGK